MSGTEARGVTGEVPRLMISNVEELIGWLIWVIWLINMVKLVDMVD